MKSADYEALRSEAAVLAALGVGLQTVIPTVLDPHKYPKRDRNTHEPILDSETGLPLPAFVGKNPSRWVGPDDARLDKPNQTRELNVILDRINLAEEYGLPIGLAAIPDGKIAIIDFDLKNFEGPDQLLAVLNRMLTQHQELKQTRIEHTPSGGLHVWVEVEDWSGWQTSSGSLHCNFSTVQGGTHQGEIITGGRRICVCAPTKRHDGAYTLMWPETGSQIVSVSSLAALGLYPTAKQQTAAKVRKSERLSLARQVASNLECGTVEQLQKLLSSKACDVLKGEKPYKAQDRSGTITAFANELHSWLNYALDQGYDFEDSVEALLEEAAETLDCSEKLDRIRDTLDHTKSFDGDTDWVEQRFRKVVLGLVDEDLDLGGYEAPDFDWQQQSPDEQSDLALSLEEIAAFSRADDISAEELFPPYLRDRLSILRETMEYDWLVMLAVLLTGLSGALPLKSQITLTPDGFIQPLTSFGVILMPSGEAKSPLADRFIRKPWKKSVDVVMKKRHQEAVKRWKSLEQDGDVDCRPPAPEYARTLVTDDFTPQGVESYFVRHEAYANGSMLILIDEGKDILKEMSGQSASTNNLKIGSWILSRYDGTGGQGAKADGSRERNYSDCRLSVLIFCQPEVYRQITGDADQTGLAGRFVVAEQLVVKQKFLKAKDIREIAVVMRELDKILAGLYQFACDRDRLELYLDDNGLDLFQEERERLDAKKHETLSDPVRAILNKSHGRIGRSAGQLHVLWSYDPEQPEKRHIPDEVTAEDMRRAIAYNKLMLSGSIIARETADGNDSGLRRLRDLHSLASKVSCKVALGKLRKSFSSTRRPSREQIFEVAMVLHRQGYGILSKDEMGHHFYQAIKPFNG